MPTSYPKCTPTELTGLLVLLKDHHGAEDLARLADDLDLEIDEILPASDFAEALKLINVDDGRVTFTEVGRRFADASIRERKTILRELLKQYKLFATLLRALESAPNGEMTAEELQRLLALTAAPSDNAVMNIINWGRFAELFRYDPEREVISLIRHRAPRPAVPAARGPPPVVAPAPPGTPVASATKVSSSGPPAQTAIAAP